MANEEEVVCVDFWCNEFGMRVRIALREKRVGFGFVEEDLRIRERSELVLQMNPVHRSIPILIHRGRPICGSLNIVEYVDEMWGQKSGARLLPVDPLERANARFWADFGDEKMAAKEELLYHLKCLEGVLGEKDFFGGKEFGFLDVALIPFSTMFYGYKQHGGIDMTTECPRLMSWVGRCEERKSVQSVLPTGLDMYDIHKEFYAFRGYEQHGGFDLEEECPDLIQCVKRCKERESVRHVLPDEDEMYELHKKWYGIE
uniref:glutathione transferase n=1 Tax=Leersia perrieri TaxID=77586 RepID=A0A0D9WVJ7_9ORYZ